MYYSNLEDFIEDTYQSMGIFTPNELNMSAIAGWLDIELEYWDEPSEAAENGGEFWILLNEDLNHKEQWQDFAHELCHVLQHEGYQQNLPNSFVLYQEVKADNFMYNFCVPTFMLQDYPIANYYNIEDGIPIIAKDFNVTEKFAKKRLIQYKNKMQQTNSDAEHRRFMESLYPKAPPYSIETMMVMEELSLLLYKKGLK
ncbi:ImmA/IrrE family metallo-endopeptidase [Lederbergia lenta]|uniref:ImmA/IrrE family metallo-endopeptidase n=1 Tax=Lederbergia lenta TaxID=1467 RepID=UPI00203CDEF0|nr:ImmA/IrrE family metallo-endopeptidase [Lederbergia lenta]MCM3111643.1 ImmA/IrrE family metallo-endopeptidase [Lederbergia lenta]